jgi:hypothetical protein
LLIFQDVFPGPAPLLAFEVSVDHQELAGRDDLAQERLHRLAVLAAAVVHDEEGTGFDEGLDRAGDFEHQHLVFHAHAYPPSERIRKGKSTTSGNHEL